MKKLSFKIGFFVLLFILSTNVAFANIAVNYGPFWEGGIIGFFILLILISVFESFFIMWLLKQPFLKANAISFSANVATAILGILIGPLYWAALNVLYNTFAIDAFAILIAIFLVNFLVESIVYKLFTKLPYKKVFLVALLANFLSYLILSLLFINLIL